MRRAAALVLAVVLAACGKQGELMPKAPPGEAAKPLPGPPPSQRLIVPTQDQPARADDPLRRSEERRDDRFNLPPQ
ncbi:MAG: hypothetical protein JO290_05095 [Sphingomonadaceae bacterium]|nr:hypothetical protein [Sphingomonadaceae bacterium]